MTTVTMPRRIPARPAPTLSCQRVGGCPARATVTALLVVALLVAASLFCVWSRLEVVRQGYANAEAAREIKTLSAQHEQLRVEAAALKSPDRIETMAMQKLGMQFPAPEQIRTLEMKSGESAKLLASRGPDQLTP